MFSRIELELVSQSLAMFNIKLDFDNENHNLKEIHQLHYSGDYPPLEITFDLEMGFIRELSFFYPVNSIVNTKKNIVMNDQIKVGCPSFEFYNLVSNEYYYDNANHLEITLYQNGIILLLDQGITKYQIKINENLYLHIDEIERIVGLTYIEPKLFSAINGNGNKRSPFLSI